MEELKNEEVLFVGTYTDTGSEGIYRFKFNLETGKLEDKTVAASLKNPSYLTFSADNKTMYAVGEVDDYEGDSGKVTAFKVKDTVLEKIDTKSSFGAHPCFVGVDKSGEFVAIANYTGGTVAIYKTLENGSLADSPQVIDHKVLDTSKTAHAHMSSFINDELFVSDLGLDRINRYSKINGEFVPSEQKSLLVAEGAGPRHFVTSEKGEFLYAINELNSTITLFQRKGEELYAINTYETVAADYKEESYCADIHLSSDGKFLYGSNRGENTIVIFKINRSNGSLELVGREAVMGDWPRNFTIDPSGNYVLVANQRSNNIVVFKRDVEKGTLSFSSQVELPSPVCLKFY